MRLRLRPSDLFKSHRAARSSCLSHLNTCTYIRQDGERSTVHRTIYASPIHAPTKRRSFQGPSSVVHSDTDISHRSRNGPDIHQLSAAGARPLQSLTAPPHRSLEMPLIAHQLQRDGRTSATPASDIFDSASPRPNLRSSNAGALGINYHRPTGSSSLAKVVSQSGLPRLPRPKEIARAAIQNAVDHFIAKSGVVSLNKLRPSTPTH